LDRAELEGLPEDYVARLEKRDGKYLITLDYPDFFPFMDNARRPEARKQLERLYNNRAAAANLPILAEVLRLRAEAASLLGYRSHAEYVLEERMAKAPRAVSAFLERLEDELRPLALEERRVLLELKRGEEGSSSDGVLHAWDWRYYDNLLKKTRYAVDQEKVKEYFPEDLVTAGMLSVYETLLGVRFVLASSSGAWHPDVKLYEVFDAAGGPPLGRFYLDLYPREGKYKHAAAFPLIKARALDAGGYQAPVAAMVANFEKPTKDHPSLLKHKEVETYFHEFGHIMHGMLTKAKYGRFSGTSVARDFVEAPSQMLENWVWSRAVLPRLSGHYLDRSKKLPDELLEKLLAAKNADAGLVYLRQVFFASVDQRFHTAEDLPDTTAEYARLMEKISLIPMSPGTHPEASFGHLMGYDAGYYGYLWSKVFAQDLFTRFERDPLDPAIGRLYRETILEPGSGTDEAALLKKFLGRAPNDRAFLKNIGLTLKEK
jgi:thimet oligopeptidase